MIWATIFSSAASSGRVRAAHATLLRVERKFSYGALPEDALRFFMYECW